MPAQFTIDADEGFYLTVAEDVTVYEAYEAAVAEIQSKLATDTDGFLAEVTVEQTGDTDDVAVTLEQVGWQRIIRDMGDYGGETAVNADRDPVGTTTDARAEDKRDTATEPDASETEH